MNHRHKQLVLPVWLNTENRAHPLSALVTLRPWNYAEPIFNFHRDKKEKNQLINCVRRRKSSRGFDRYHTIGYTSQFESEIGSRNITR